MTHKNPEFDHEVERVIDKWNEVRVEVETKITLGRLEVDHLKLIDNVEERLIAVTGKTDRFIGELTNACTEAEHLRTRVRRKLLKEGTATEISYSAILPT